MDWARARREAERRLADLRGKLEAAQRDLSSAESALALADRRFSVADERVAETERALDEAIAERDKARRQRYAARRDRDRLSTVVDRLQRRMADVASRLGRIPPLAFPLRVSHGRCQKRLGISPVVPAPGGGAWPAPGREA